VDVGAHGFGVVGWLIELEFSSSMHDLMRHTPPAPWGETPLRGEKENQGEFGRSVPDSFVQAEKDLQAAVRGGQGGAGLVIRFRKVFPSQTRFEVKCQAYPAIARRISPVSHVKRGAQVV
jgi:hypothetical protein